MIGSADHRPWPPPAGPWVMAMTWHDLLFAHWPVPLADLQRSVPPALTIDTYDGQAWIAVVPFRMSGVRPRGVPSLPGLSAFPELNVRTYVTRDGKPGVWFFSLDAGNRVAVAAARRWFHLPYFHAQMALVREGDGVRYSSRRVHRASPGAEFAGQYAPTGEVALAQKGTLAHWLTERYCLYAADGRGRLYRGEIHHAQWPLQPAEAQINTNSMTLPLTIPLPRDVPPLLHFARRLEVVVWPLRRVKPDA